MVCRFQKPIFVFAVDHNKHIECLNWDILLLYDGYINSTSQESWSTGILQLLRSRSVTWLGIKRDKLKTRISPIKTGAGRAWNGINHAFHWLSLQTGGGNSIYLPHSCFEALMQVKRALKKINGRIVTKLYIRFKKTDVCLFFFLPDCKKKCFIFLAKFNIWT